MKTCEYCFNQNRDSAAFCDACGIQLKSGAESPSGLDRASVPLGDVPRCPNCESDEIRRSKRRTSYDHLLWLFGLLPYRCENCDYRFLRPSSRMGREVPTPPQSVVDSSSPQVNGLAIASFVSGCLFFLLPAALAAIVLGHVSRKQIRESGGRQEDDGMARTGLSLGYAGVALMVAIVIVAGIAKPKLAREQMKANEASAIRALRYISFACGTYSKTYQHGFPPTLNALAPPPSGAVPSEAAADLIGPGLTAGTRRGYIFSYHAAHSESGGAIGGFGVNADPVTPGTTGERHFFVDETGTIRVEMNAPASRASPPLVYDPAGP